LIRTIIWLLGGAKAVLKEALRLNIDIIYFDIIGASEEDCYTPRFLDCKTYEVLDGKSFWVKYGASNGPFDTMIKREFVEREELRFVEGRYCEDGMFAVASMNRAQAVTHCHADVYRHVVRPNSTITRRDSAHMKKMVDDFLYAVTYINGFILREKESGGDKEYIHKLTLRRNSYIFFMQARMIRAKLDKKKRNEILDQLEQMGCYPYESMGYNELKFHLLEPIFWSRALFSLVSEVYKIVGR
jgi:hypothetical protein